MASDYAAIRADNERRYGTDIGRIATTTVRISSSSCCRTQKMLSHVDRHIRDRGVSPSTWRMEHFG
jgi:hypothetical protein